VAKPPPRHDTEPDSELGPLPGGHHGLSRQEVAESQRERLLAGLALAVARNGYQATTITQIVAAASVSTRAFYEQFPNKEDCFLAAFEAIDTHLRELLAAAAASEREWPAKVVAVLRAALAFFDAEPDLARLCLVEAVTATPRVTARFREAIVACIPYLQAGRAERPAGAEPLPESTEDSLLGGLVVLVSRAISAGDDSLTDLLPDLVEFVLAPYLGPKAAKQLAQQAADADEST
jgi:AcrR family transcriptional regulator